MKVEPFTNNIDYTNSIADDGNGALSVNLYVEGIKCGSCIWLIENTLNAQPNIKVARINLSTNRLYIGWQGNKEYINELVQLIQNLGYKLLPFDIQQVEDTEQLQQKVLLKCIAVAAFANVQLMMIVMGIWFADSSLGDVTRHLLHLIAMVIAIPCIFYSGLPFFKSAFAALKAKRSNMDIPISLSIICTTLISIQEYWLNSAYTYFDSATMLILALLVGRYLDYKSRSHAKQQARNLLLLQPKFATIYHDGNLMLVPVSQLKVGDILHINAGENIPADGILVSTNAEIDNSIITGETEPCNMEAGATLYAGSINLSNAIKVQINKVGDNTVLAEIIKLMELAEQGRAKFVRIADIVAGQYTLFVLLVSLFTMAYWLVKGIGFSKAILYAISVLIITCPCALGLAVPIVQIVTSARMMKLGILIKNADALERMAQIDTIVFDKTGTLTTGKPIIVADAVNYIERSKMDVIVAVAAYSNHPLAKALVEYYPHFIPLDLEVQEVKGMGLETSIDGKKIKLGNAVWCNIEPHIKLNGKADDGLYMTEMWFCIEDEAPIRILFQDGIREETLKAVELLQEKHYKLWIISGDKTSVVTKIANKLNINNFRGDVYPNEKYDFIEQLTQSGKKVMMIGDGMNDTAALKRAHVSMSLVGALDIAQNAADLLLQGKLTSIAYALELAKYSNQVIKQNFILALLYNGLSVPLACMGFVTPLIAAIAMSTSSIFVIINSLKIKNHELIDI